MELEAKLNNEENQWSRVRRSDGGDFHAVFLSARLTLHVLLCGLGSFRHFLLQHFSSY
jgi:hypothetical protein